ncbi:MAG: FAD-dependent oxidoreductase [Chloroflexi bacterium]|nr:MAG: FAD-dependent oxidoreductase [Chloroflexota bacterium]
MTSGVDVAIIGAGQAGLATSWYLTQANVDHVVLDAGRVAETWRTRRWDSFCLVTPNWSVKLPGAEYAGPEPDGFMARAELVAHIQGWADEFHAPVQENCAVAALDADSKNFVLTTSSGKIRARKVVVASGGYQRAHLPANANQIPDPVIQILAEDYTNPGGIPPGAVIIVGSGQTGCQLAEELHESGRKVFLSCGKCPWAPRRLGGNDLVWWVVESGFWDRTPDQLPSPFARLTGNPQTTGRGGGHDLNYRTLHAMGVELVGRYEGAGDGKVHFADDLTETIDAGDTMSANFKKWIDALCERRALDLPWEMPPPMRVAARTEVDIAQEGIGTVIWTSGYRPAYGWVHFPVFDDMGFPIQQDGRSSVAGLYFMGVHFQRKAKSAVLYGVGEDAELVAQHIVDNSR